jgi:predicted  nucleic acid-binding Zn-ribbon protein
VIKWLKDLFNDEDDRDRELLRLVVVIDNQNETIRDLGKERDQLSARVAELEQQVKGNDEQYIKVNTFFAESFEKLGGVIEEIGKNYMEIMT